MDGATLIVSFGKEKWRKKERKQRKKKKGNYRVLIKKVRWMNRAEILTMQPAPDKDERRRIHSGLDCPAMGEKKLEDREKKEEGEKGWLGTDA